MKSLLFTILFCLCLFAMCSCGMMVMVETPPTGGKISEKEAPKVMIFPFFTYENIAPSSWLVVNIKIYEALADHLVAKGFDPVSLENTLTILQEEGVLTLQQPSIKIPSTVADFLSDPEWSPIMKEEIYRTMMKHVKPMQVQLDLKKLTSFSENKLLTLARQEGADLLFTGRITRLRIREEETLNPFRIGFITFLTRAPCRLFYGAPENEKYGRMQEFSIGVLWGALLGTQAKDPFEPPTYQDSFYGHPLFPTTVPIQISGTSDYQLGNSIVWGLVGGATAFLASHGGYSPEAAVTLSLSVYDVRSGKKIWTGRTKLKVSPTSVFAARAKDKLFEVAVDEAINLLMAKFWTDFDSATLQKLAFLPSPPQNNIETRVQELVYQAERAAERAEKAALKTERIFEKNLKK